MAIRSLTRHGITIGLLLLSGCEAARSMRDDFNRLTSSQAAAYKAQPARSTNAPARPRPVPATPTTQEAAAAPSAPAADEPPAHVAAAPAVSLAGKSETELRAMLGAPTSEEDRPPGKRWRYRDG